MEPIFESDAMSISQQPSDQQPIDDRNGFNPTAPSSNRGFQALSSTPQSAPVSAQAVDPPSSASLNAAQVLQYMNIADKRTKQLIKNWEPRPLSQIQQMEWRAETNRLIRMIRLLEAEKARIAPRVDRGIETNLFMARVDYRVKFSRIFRINDLPTEIICNIFHFVIWSNTEHAKSIQTRLYLTWTCRHWRKVALEDPTLWTVIWWKDGPKFSRSKTWLSRSANAPKDIRISDYDGDKAMDVKTIDTILQRIIPRLATVRVLIIVLKSWDSVLYALDQFRMVRMLQKPMILERFEIHRSGAPWVQIGPGYEPYQEPVPLFGGMSIPTLRYLSLSAVHIDWAKSPLSNLTTLDIRQLPLDRAPDFAQFRAILANSPMLTKLILDSAGPNFNGRMLDDVDFPPIPLLHLKILAIADFSPQYGVYLLSHLKAPNILDLTLLNMSNDDYSSFFAAMTGMVPKLQVLTIFNGHLIPATMPHPEPQRIAIMRWLESMPKITFLRFGNVRKSFLEMFLGNPENVHRQYPENNVLAPNLVFLEWQRMDYKIVLEWSQQRKRLGVPLKKMYVNFEETQKFDAEVRKALTDSMGEGGEVLLLRPGHKAPEESSLQR